VLRLHVVKVTREVIERAAHLADPFIRPYELQHEQNHDVQ